MKTVYGLVDPRDSQIRYVGYSGDLEHRMSTHYQDAKKRRKGKRCEWLRELLTAELRAKIIWLGEADGGLADELERFWIAELRRLGADLTNESTGGPGNPGLHHDAETRARIGAYWKGRKRAPRTEEHKKKLSEALAGRGPSPEIQARAAAARRGGTGSALQRQRTSEAMKKCWSDPEWRANWHERKRLAVESRKAKEV